jgi:alpha-beta hydrolase superfamily lysophospholipase
MDAAREQAPLLQVPTLMLTGARDQVVPPQAHAEFARLLPDSGRCTVVTYVNGWHLLLRDLQRERVYADALGWIADRAPPSGLGRPCGEAATTPLA